MAPKETLARVIGDTFKTKLGVSYCSAFVGSAWSFGFFIPATRANDPRL